ncbi:DUF2243 domain-containing protein [Inquilinus limosus]|uniref:DUF2243 domain-containing protein n=1 Tax=Inquilinus limosus TaxID=171674 RepID=UPI0003F594E4|nr:DUF2243 domain-containing protein [Inquilinus limosus]
MGPSPRTKWGVALGFALGGFFDGILLHQILQWHHLLSLVPGAGDLRMQVLWDGYFHALMYVIAAVALWGLWRGRRTGDDGGPLSAAVLAGFGLWHVVDGVLSHWVLGLHRIRLDSASPLAWDLLWFAVFGLLPLALGWLVLRRGAGGPTQGAVLGLLLLAGVSGAAGAWALRPPPGQPFTTVVFRPGLEPQEVLGALDAAEARLVWSDPAMGVVVVAVAPQRRWSFYRHGALLVGGSGVPAGCIGWSRAQAAAGRALMVSRS